MVTDPLEVNGHEPPIVGCALQELFAMEYAHAGEVAEPANVVHLKFEDRWYRLYFDSGIVFWRSSDAGPVGFDAAELDATFTPVDLAEKFGVRHHRLLCIHYQAVPGGSIVRLEFDGSREVTFSSICDVTTYA